MAAIAFPQYQKAVLKSRLHTGIPIVASLYQAQQSYFLAHGDYATDIDSLDLSIPIDDSCTKEESNSYSRYACSFGRIGIGNSNIMYRDPSENLQYVYYFKDHVSGKITFTAGTRYCFAIGEAKNAVSICQQMGEAIDTCYSNASWCHFKL